MAWPDGGTNPVVESVGATARDYATIATWEAATDEDCTAGWGAAQYADPCSPVGDCYDDADFTGTLYLYSATTSEDYYRTLTVHEGQRHNGTAYGGGAELVTSASYAVILRDQFVVFEWLILSGTSAAFGPYYCPENSRIMMRNLVSCSSGGGAFYSTNAGAGTLSYLRNSIAHSNSGIFAGSFTYVQNCSFFVSTVAYAVRDSECTNVICVGASPACFYQCTGDYNIGSDTTAPGANSIDNIAAADLFANVGAGTEDLHLKSDVTAASDTGLPLGGNFTDDIDGDTRTDWDIGADEWVGEPPAGVRTKRLTLLGAA